MTVCFAWLVLPGEHNYHPQSVREVAGCRRRRWGQPRMFRFTECHARHLHGQTPIIDIWLKI
jgi:hypothetical protein